MVLREPFSIHSLQSRCGCPPQLTNRTDKVHPSVGLAFQPIHSRLFLCLEELLRYSGSPKQIRVTRLMPVLDFGGVESRITLQAEMIDRDRFDYRVCTFWKAGAAAERIRAAGIQVDVLDVDPAVRNPIATKELAAYLRRNPTDILHASISEANFHGAVAGALTGVPIRIVEEVGIPSRGRLGTFVFGQMYGLANRVVGVSKATCKVLLQEGAGEEKVHLIYNCANPSFFTGKPEEIIARPDSPPVEFLAVGRLVPVKNHLNLLRAFRKALNQNPSIRLRIAGEGPLRGDMESLIEELELQNHVQLLGFQSDVRSLLHTSHFFLLPSWSEGCSISLVEAMSSDIVPFGSTADGIGEVMGKLGSDHQIPADDVDGWANALLRASRMTSAERFRIGAAAREIAFRRFSPAVYIGNVSQMYEEMARSILI